MIRWQRNRVRPLTRKSVGRLAILGLAKVGIVGIALAHTGNFRPVLVYNASASVPLGYYRVLRTNDLNVSDIVLLHTPASVRELADQRRYLPKSVPMIKYVAALSGDEVCAAGDEIRINGKIIARRKGFDRLNRPLPTWSGCRILASDEMFLLNSLAPESFDGRYFGVVKTTLVIGRLAPL